MSNEEIGRTDKSEIKWLEKEVLATQRLLFELAKLVKEQAEQIKELCEIVKKEVGK